MICLVEISQPRRFFNEGYREESRFDQSKRRKRIKISTSVADTRNPERKSIAFTLRVNFSPPISVPKTWTDTFARHSSGQPANRNRLRFVLGAVSPMAHRNLLVGLG